ncbi:MAG TPA: amidase [Anaerolineae bacterium]
MISYPESIEAARADLRAGRLSPSELIGSTIERIQALNPSLNAYLHVFDPPHSLTVREGELAGIPIAVKDLFDVAGYPTTAGSPFFKDNVAAEDAFVIRKLRAAGAILIGKTNPHEWALGVTNNNPHFGACRNPWDIDRIPGGSSGGSAAAIAAGLCLGALGTDTGGSIRIPAALCGIVGLKPTHGRTSLRGVVPLSWSHDHAGPMARTVRDAAILLQIIAGYDPLDPASVDAPVPDYLGALSRSVDLTGVRIGVPAGYFFEELDRDVERAMREAIEALRRLGAAIIDIDLPEASEMADTTRVILLSDAAAYHRERLESHAEMFGADVLARLNMGRAFTGTAYALARQARRRWKQRLRQVFDSVDVLVTPTTPIPAMRIDEAEGVASAGQLTRFTSLFNFAGTPAISVPCGFTSGASRLPIGMQIIGRWWDEVAVLRVAYVYEQATDWHTQSPPIGSSDTDSHG